MENEEVEQTEQTEQQNYWNRVTKGEEGGEVLLPPEEIGRLEAAVTQGTQLNYSNKHMQKLWEEHIEWMPQWSRYGCRMSANLRQEQFKQMFEIRLRLLAEGIIRESDRPADLLAIIVHQFHRVLYILPESNRGWNLRKGGDEVKRFKEHDTKRKNEQKIYKGNVPYINKAEAERMIREGKERELMVEVERQVQKREEESNEQ